MAARADAIEAEHNRFTILRETLGRVCCADGEAHYRFGQDVWTFKNLQAALASADDFGQMCGPHWIGVPVHG